MKKIIYSTFIFFLFVTQVIAQDAMYVHLKTGVTKFLIADIDSVKFEETTVTQYNYFISKAASTTFIHYGTTIPTINAPSDFNIVYNGSTSTNLNDLVWATASNGVVEKTFAEYGLGTVGVNCQFVFSNSFAYTGLDGVTNQNSFIQIESDGRITVVGGTSAIDRTPVVKVELKNMSGVLLAQAYIKLKIVNSSTPPPVNTMPVSYMQPAVTCTYTSLYRDAVPGVSAGDYMDINLTWIAMNGIYSSLGVSHNEFQAIFGALTPAVAVKVNDIAVPGATLSQYPLIRSILSPNIDTYAMKYQVSPLAKFGTTSVTYTFTPSNTAYPVLNITFTYTVTKPEIRILSGYQNPDANSITTQGMKTANEYLMQVYLGEAFGYNTGEYASSFGSTIASKIDGATHTFAFAANTPNQGLAALLPASGGSINATLGSSPSNYSGQLLKLVSPMNVSTLTFNLEFITNFPNGEKYVFPFNVTFMNPITIESTTGDDITLTDFIDGRCDEKQVALSRNATVKFQGRNVIVNGVATPDAAMYGITASNYTYGVAQNQFSGISLLNPNAAMSTVKWCNAGAALVSKVLAGSIGPVFTTAFATLSSTVHNIYVQPENNAQ